MPELDHRRPKLRISKAAPDHVQNENAVLEFAEPIAEVTITVLGVKGSHVRLGFAAPRDVAVHGEEIYERMRSGPIDITEARRALVE